MAALVDGKNFMIDGVSFYAKSIRNNYESLATEDSGRTLDGVMHIYWVFNNIRKVEIEMPPCTYEMIRDILRLVQGREYTLTFFDPMIGTLRSIQCYTSNSHADMYSGVVHNGLWTGFTFNAIEIAGDIY